MGQRIAVVDAFTRVPFEGNPAAVCVLDAPSTDAAMQRLAQEMRHSETAFACRLARGDFELRWFTPETEVILCGHATLATAHILWEEGWVAPERAIDEDPVTGSAHCTLGPYWARALDTCTLRARQISRRGGELALQVTEEHVTIAGSCVTVLRGALSQALPRAAL